MSVPRIPVSPHLRINAPVSGSVPAETSGSEAWGRWYSRIFGPVQVTCALALTGLGHPWYIAVDSATGGTLYSGRHGVGAGCT